MFVVSKRNIILPGPNGEKFHVPRDYMGPVPDWAEGSAYLKALAEDGKVIISATGKDKDIDAAGKNGKKRGKGKTGKDPAPAETETGEQPEEPPEDPDIGEDQEEGS